MLVSGETKPQGEEPHKQNVKLGTHSGAKGKRETEEVES